MKVSFKIYASTEALLKALVQFILHELMTTGYHPYASRQYSVPVVSHDDPRVIKAVENLPEAGDKFYPLSMTDFKAQHKLFGSQGGLGDTSTLAEWEIARSEMNQQLQASFLARQSLRAAVVGFVYGTPYKTVDCRTDESEEYDDGLKVEGADFHLWVKKSRLSIRSRGDGLFEVEVSGRRTSLAANQTGRLADYLLNAHAFKAEISTLNSSAPEFDCHPLRLFKPTTMHRLRVALYGAGSENDLPWIHGVAVHRLVSDKGILAQLGMPQHVTDAAMALLQAVDQ